MAIKKSDLYSSLWQSCDELRGGMDASQYKDYVLFMLFIKYVTDKYGDSDDFTPAVTIPKGASFKDMLELRGKSDVGDKINTQVIAPLVNANTRLALSDFPDFNDPNKLGEGNEMVERLTNLINIFASPNLDFSQNRAEHDDLLGDAYEYLMRHFATESGKSKGQFYTPAEVSRVIARTIGISPENTKGSTTAYDPTCGSGSLLLKVAAEAGKRITLEGQEKDVTTAGLARMNLILHDFPTATITSGNTLTAPRFKDGGQLRTYDYVVANPPFSDKNWTTGLTPAKDPFQRFAWGEPPAKQGDYAYLLHIIRSMKGSGKAACVLPHGVLFRGHAEATIRERLVRSGYLKGIIGLPPNLFYGTGIPACIVVLDKENAAGRKGVFMIDAARGFTKDGPKNRLREQDIHRIVDTFERQVDVPRFARMVPFDEITNPKNNFNLNLPRYIDSAEPEDLQDIDGHLRGGIPERDVDAFEAYWRVFPGLRGVLFESADRAGYLRLTPALADVKRTILEHTEFSTFQQTVEKVFADWRDSNTPTLTEFGEGGHPKSLIDAISEALLAAFRPAPLLDAYDLYQHLMDYWAESMQDDAYLIVGDGWVNGVQPREIFRVKGKNNKLIWPEIHDYLKGRRRFKSDLVPAPILVAHYFAAERDVLMELNDEVAALEQRLDDLREENGGEDGLLAEVIEGEGRKITAKAVKARLKDIGNDPLYNDERATLEEYADWLQQHSAVKGKRNAGQKDLDEKIDAKYPELTEAEIKAMVVEHKWMDYLSAAVQSEINRVSQTLTGRMQELAERYAVPLPKLTENVEGLTVRVEAHLEKMGAVWK
ncbi:MAG: N-6 DNA methylase [Gammaproteobacteria bacterium]|nr:N-6 DNA methylase [Gammaproteobacteria bacterium]